MTGSLLVTGDNGGGGEPPSSAPISRFPDWAGPIHPLNRSLKSNRSIRMHQDVIQLVQP